MQAISPGTKGGENGEILVKTRAYCSPWGRKQSDTTERLNWLVKGCKLPDIRWINSGDLTIVRASLVAQTVNSLPTMQITQVRKIPWRREWLPTPVFLPREFHGQRLQSMESQRVGHIWGANTFTFSNGKGIQKRRYIYIYIYPCVCIADSLFYIVETNTL